MSRNRRIGTKAKTKWAQSMNRVIDGLGRRVMVYLPERRSECPNCYYDKVHDKSSGVSKVDPSSPTYFTIGRCPVCHGRGVLTTTIRKCIHAIVIWNPQGYATNTKTYSEAGWEGAMTAEIKTDKCNTDIIKRASYISIDGVKCKMTNGPIIRGVGGQAILVAQFMTVDKPRVDSGEIINPEGYNGPPPDGYHRPQ